MDVLVPGRTCGDCTACCTVLTIDSPELLKAAGIACKHLAPGARCSIYETRPHDCRAFYCGWRLFPLPDPWRPDRCGVMLIVGTDVAPDGRQDTVRIHLFQSLERILWAPVVAYIRHLIGRGVPTFVSISGPPGHAAARVFLNGSANLRNALATNDPAQIAAVLWDAVQTCVEHPKEPVVFEHAPPQSP